MLKRSMLLLLGAVSFAAVSSALRPAVPWPGDAGVAARMACFAEQKDGFDVLFAGSSNIQRGIIPAVFDRRMSERGYPVRSFNLAAAGMHSFEVDFVLREALAFEPVKLRYVFQELLYSDMGELVGENAFTDRVIFWHTPARTLDVLETLRRWPASAGERLRLATLHLHHAAWRFANLGQGERGMRVHLGEAEHDPTLRARIAETGGLDWLGRPPTASETRARLNFLSRRSEWEQRVGTIERGNAAAGRVDRFNLEAHADRLARLHSHGVEPIFAIAPLPIGTPMLHRLDEAGELGRVLAYNRPSRFPELYAFEHRFDWTHLNREGAALWSRLLADDLADWIERRDLR
jgi:hypothetical protein